MLHNYIYKQEVDIFKKFKNKLYIIQRGLRLLEI